MTIKAIETKYKGYRFRSRLEARWAVFFDALGLDWEYEPEGFDLGDGVWYLPDFRVKYPDGSIEWLEVKGDISSVSVDECRKIFEFSKHNRIIVLDGTPRGTMFQGFDPWQHDGDGCDRLTIELIVSDLRGLASVKQNNRSGYSLWSYKGRPWWDEWVNFRDCPEMGLPDVEYAAKKARSARFEHGESPQ